MTDTANLALPCIEGSQAQKHVTHNDALRILDTLVQLAVLTRTLSAPPASPSDGQRWIVKATGTGAWAGHDNAVAAWQDGAWIFSAPRTGWLAYVVDEPALVAWNGSTWVAATDALSTPTALDNMTRLGVGTAADTTNPVAAKLNNTLWVAQTAAEGGSGDLRFKLSKEAAADTLSFLFQDNYSARAEIGLTGDDDFHFKVSADGSTWHEGIVIDRTTGEVTFPNSTIASPGGFQSAMVNGTIVESHAANAVTFAVKTLAGGDPSAGDPVDFFFRSATAGNGGYVRRSVTAALSITIASTKTLGTANGTAFRLWLVAVDTGSGVALGVVNCRAASAIVPLNEDQLISPTATPGNSAGIIYTASGQTAKPFRKIGFASYESGLTTAGTWNVSPTRLQLFGPGIKSPGDVVQITETVDTTTRTTTSNSYTSSGVAVTLTPTSAANPMQLLLFAGTDNATASQTNFFDIERGATSLSGVLGTDSLANLAKMNTNAGVMPFLIALTDDPHTNSALTYTLYWKVTASTGTLGARNGGLNTQPTVLRVSEIMG